MFIKPEGGDPYGVPMGVVPRLGPVELHDNVPLIGPPLPSAYGYMRHDAGAYAFSADQMHTYAQQAVEAERERCAKVCEKQFTVGDHDWRVSRAAAEKCAAAIRCT